MVLLSTMLSVLALVEQALSVLIEQFVEQV